MTDDTTPRLLVGYSDDAIIVQTVGGAEARMSPDDAAGLVRGLLCAPGRDAVLALADEHGHVETVALSPDAVAVVVGNLRRAVRDLAAHRHLVEDIDGIGDV